MDLSPTSAISAALLPEPSIVRRVPDMSLAKASVPPAAEIGGTVMVQFSRHAETGAQVVTFVDKRTGETLDQLPAKQVLDAVAELMQMFRKREA
jgi:hypothetical protein